MCMKYINATATCFQSVTVEDNRIISFDVPFDSVKSETKEAIPAIGKFSIITQINFLGTNNSQHQSKNPLAKRGIVDFIIRLTKCDPLGENCLGLDLDVFSVNLEEMYEKGQVDSAYLEFLTYTRVTNVNEISLPAGIGKYVVKVLVKNSTDEEFSIQSMSSLNIL